MSEERGAILKTTQNPELSVAPDGDRSKWILIIDTAVIRKIGKSETDLDADGGGHITDINAELQSQLLLVCGYSLRTGNTVEELSRLQLQQVVSADPLPTQIHIRVYSYHHTCTEHNVCKTNKQFKALVHYGGDADIGFTNHSVHTYSVP